MASTLIRKFTAAEFDRLVELGILGEDEHLELVDGELRLMAAMSNFHRASLMQLHDELHSQLLPAKESGVIVFNQVTIQLGEWRPEPDLTLVAYRSDYYRHGGLTSEHIRLVIEISDTSLEYDRDDKVLRYAEHNIQEVWLADIKRQVFIVYRRPEGKQYQEVFEQAFGKPFAPQALPEIIGTWLL